MKSIFYNVIAIFTSFIFINFDMTIAKLFCPPLKAHEGTNLTCELPEDRQKLNCSSSWLPDGTVATYQCYKTNGIIRMGRIRCKGDTKFREFRSESLLSINKTLPCGLYEDRSAPEFHVYGYQQPLHYPVPQNNVSSDFRMVGLKLQNSFRQQHNSKPLILDSKLNEKAQNWAEHLASRGLLDMASEPSLGQNIFNSDRSDKIEAISDSVQFWYNAGYSAYNWTQITSNWVNSLALDFSQIVWKSTKRLGIGAASRPLSESHTNSTVIVAFYSPMGNIVLEDADEPPEKLFIQNVFPLTYQNLTS